MFQKNRWGVLCSIIFSLVMIFSVSGCAKKAVSGDPGTAADKVVSAESKTAAQSGALASGEATPVVEAAPAAITEYIVKKGDSLWVIAKDKDIYDDDFLWPIIYKANKGQIKNPDMIYPGQKLKIPRDGYSMDDIKKARKKAGAKKPYTPPQKSKPPMK